jgi:sec-independent protein translocase protein TatB
MFDFGVGYSEMFVLAVIAVIVIGPKDLPRVLRTFGQFMSKAKGMAREFQGHVDAAMKDAGVDGLKKDLAEIKSTVSHSVSAPGGVMAPMALSPSLAPSSAYAISSSQKDFESYFGAADSEGETRVAGTKVLTTS